MCIVVWQMKHTHSNDTDMKAILTPWWSVLCNQLNIYISLWSCYSIFWGDCSTCPLPTPLYIHSQGGKQSTYVYTPLSDYLMLVQKHNLYIHMYTQSQYNYGEAGSSTKSELCCETVCVHSYTIIKLSCDSLFKMLGVVHTDSQFGEEINNLSNCNNPT